MPLLDHFRPPLEEEWPWESIHSGWANSIAVRLNGALLPQGYLALPNVRLGPQVEVDVATLEHGGGTARSRLTWI